MPKLLKSTCTKLSCLSTCKKLMSSLTSFLRYCEDIANLLFQELWECLSISIKSYIINLQHNFMLIYMLKINFITHFSLKILQKNSKLVILGKLGMSGHTHLNYTINWKKPWTFICRQKTNFILHVFLEILQRYCKLVILVTLGMSGRTQSGTINFQNIFVFICRQTIPGDIAKTCKLLILGILGMSGYTHPKPLMFTCTPKIYFIIHFS